MNCQRFSGFGKISKSVMATKCHGSVRVLALGYSSQLNTKLEMPNSPVFVSLCADIVQYKSEIHYSLIDSYCVSVDCVLQKSRNLLLFSTTEGEGRGVQMRVQGKINNKSVRKGNCP